MIPPLLSYVTFNRLGLTIKNLPSILESTDDFEMHIIDNNSSDDTWEYIQSLDDSRILSKTRIGINYGQIYSTNINLIKRRPEQYFFTVDSDVYFETRNWISEFLKVFEEFTEVGLLGVQRGEPYPNKLPRVIHKIKDRASYLEIDNTYPDLDNYIPSCCMVLKPELINEIGYFSEENYFGAMELCYRVNNFTPFKSGFVTDIKIKMPQITDCSSCQYKDICTLNKDHSTCFSTYEGLYKNEEFYKKFKWKLDETIKDMRSHARPVYCASSSDISSTSNHIYNQDWATENFGFYVNNAN